MPFHTIQQAPAHLKRSGPAVPGSAPQMFEKAAKSDADVIFLDLEGCRAAARRAAVPDREGKWAIHPSQIAGS